MDTITTMARSAVGGAQQVWSRLQRWVRDHVAGGSSEAGQGLAEYALILALIAIAVIGALAFFGQQLLGVLMSPIGSSFGDIVSDIIGP